MYPQLYVEIILFSGDIKIIACISASYVFLHKMDGVYVSFIPEI